MKRQILIRPAARQDLVEQYVFIAHDHEEAADRFLQRADETFQNLSLTPDMGSLQTFKNPKLVGMRKWPIHDFERHLIFYRSLEKAIEIIRVLYATRDIKTILENNPSA